MNVVNIVNNSYFNITNVSMNIITGNEKDLQIYGNVNLNKDMSNMFNLYPVVVLDVINNDDSIIYHECIEPFQDSPLYLNPFISFVITIKDYQRFFALDSIKEFKLYTILKKT
ncbi:MAG: hypothetical protein ACI4WH_08560 [Oscillospiraceae bacterium]